jgi:hypothetical protein
MNDCVECVQEQVSHLEQISADILYLYFSVTCCQKKSVV